MNVNTDDDDDDDNDEDVNTILVNRKEEMRSLKLKLYTLCMYTVCVTLLFSREAHPKFLTSVRLHGYR